MFTQSTLTEEPVANNPPSTAYYSTTRTQTNPNESTPLSPVIKDTSNKERINSAEKTDSKNQSVPGLEIADVVMSSKFTDTNRNNNIMNIVSEFNRGKTPIVKEDIVFGTRIRPDEFRLVHRNNKAQLVPFTPHPMRFEVNFTGVQKDIEICKQNKLLIGAFDTYLVNVPQKQIAKAWINNQAVLLGEGAHVIHDATFKLENNPLVNVTEPVIQHGNITILQIPKGKIAKIWEGTKPILLESQGKPHVFNSQQIQLDSFKNGNNNSYFIDASEKIITHGSIKRVMPSTGEVIYGYDNGKLVVFEANEVPYYLDSPTIKIIEKPLSTQVQNMRLPTDRAKERSKKDGVTDQERLNLEVFRTSDGSEIGVNLEVVYKIIDAKQVLKQFNIDNIENHIESIVVSDMNALITKSQLSDFQSTEQHQIRIRMNSTKQETVPEPSAPPPESFYQNLRVQIQDMLVKQLKDLGIELSRVSLDPPKLLSSQIADVMTQNSMNNAKTKAQISNLENQFAISQQEAIRTAEQARIKAENEARLKNLETDTTAKTRMTKAQSELDAAKMESEAAKIRAEADAKVKEITVTTEINMARMKNKAELDARESNNNLELEFLRKRAELLEKSPSLLQLQMAEIYGKSMSGVTQVLSPETFRSWYGSPMAMFGNANSSNPQQLPDNPDARPNGLPSKKN